MELLEILNIEIDKALKEVMKIDFQELNIQELFAITKSVSSIINQSISGIKDILSKFKASLFPNNFENLFNNIKLGIPSYSLPKYSLKKRKIKNYKNIEKSKCYKKKKNL